MCGNYKAVINLTPGGGTCAAVCIMARVVNMIFTLSDMHGELLYKHLLKMMFKFMSTEGVWLYDQIFAQLVKDKGETLTPTPKGVKGAMPTPKGADAAGGGAGSGVIEKLKALMATKGAGAAASGAADVVDGADDDEEWDE